MRWFSRERAPTVGGPILKIDNLDVYYGRAHALQGVSLTLEQGVLGVVGRNGMGKTTLCNAITGLVPATGSIRLAGQEILGLPPHVIADRGVGYVPQGRRVWPSLSVDEHLRLAAKSARRGAWTVERVYDLFPRLAERRGNGGSQLSGGEQQMLAIGRALMTNPTLLVLDEASEGLAPLLREEIWRVLATLREAGLAILAVDKYVERLVALAGHHTILEKGRVAWAGPSAALAADRSLWERYLGV